MLAGLAWRNLWRRPQRTALSLLSIAIVAALLVCMLSFQISVYGTMKEATLRIFDGYAQFQPPGYADDPGLVRTISDPDGLVRQAIAVKGVTAAAPLRARRRSHRSPRRSAKAAIWRRRTPTPPSSATSWREICGSASAAR
jgi:putative ABC transport system permease protein